MKALFIECRSGAAGDMITAALSGLLEDREGFVRRINDLGLPGVSFSLRDGQSHMIGGTICDVKVDGHDEDECDGTEPHHAGGCGEAEGRPEKGCGDDESHHHHHHHHHHTAYNDVRRLIESLDISEKVRGDALAVYEIIAEAESRVHNTAVTDIHFHEVGTADAVCDVVSACLLFDMIGAGKVVVSPVCTGYGTVKTCHGVLPVPAPATAEILKGIPVYAGEIKGELCTPTGAAILRYFADSFEEMPPMRLDGSGTGIGHRDTGAANVLRAFLGESSEKVREETRVRIPEGGDNEEDKAGKENSPDRDRVTVYNFTVDDMTAEAIAFAMEAIRKAGALDVYGTPVIMKKNRPGTLVTVLCRAADEERVERAVFRHTLTIGVRKERQERLVISREETVRKTPLGDISFKRSSGFGTVREKAEYEDVAAAAEREGMSFDEVKRIVENGQK